MDLLSHCRGDTYNISLYMRMETPHRLTAQWDESQLQPTSNIFIRNFVGRLDLYWSLSFSYLQNSIISISPIFSYLETFLVTMNPSYKCLMVVWYFNFYIWIQKVVLQGESINLLMPHLPYCDVIKYLSHR